MKTNWPQLINVLLANRTLTSKGAEYALEVVTSPPSRNPSNTRGGNLIVDFASHKMGHTCAVESATLEAADAQVLELTERCVGYFPQPKALPILCTCRDGKKHVVWLTFDFLVLWSDGIEIHECKPEAECVRLSQEFPGRYQKRDNGTWGGPEIETALAEYGLKFRIITEPDVPPTLLRNYAVLAEVTKKDYSAPAALQNLHQQFNDADAGVSLRTLLDRTNTAGYAKNDIYIAIARGHIFVALSDQLLRDDETTLVFAQQHQMEAYRLANLVPKELSSMPILLKTKDRVMWNRAEYTVCNVAKNTIYLRSSTGDPVKFPRDLFCRMVQEKEIVIPEEVILSRKEIAKELAKLFRAMTSAHQAEAITKVQFLEFLAVNPTAKPADFGLDPVTDRTIQRWKKAAADAVQRYGTAIWGLVAQPRSGRPRDDLPAKQRELASAVAEELYFSTVRRTANYCWREYKRRSDEIQQRAMSKGAFRRQLRRMKNLRDATQSRCGPGVAYKYDNNPGDGLNWITACDFPFKIGQIDGKLQDIELVDDETGESLGRPSITLLMLPYYGMPIGWALLLEPESYRSATMAVRDAYKRFGRVVRYLMPDNGKAFDNTTFDQLLGVLWMSRIPRPPEDPRFSPDLESFWNTLDAEVVRNLAGNTQASRDAREMTEETNPKRHAVWTLSAYSDLIEKYLFELIPDAPSAKLGTTPRKALERDLARAPDQDEFALPVELTETTFFPEVDGRTRFVQPGRGVYVEGYYYWHDDLAKPGIERENHVVRYDPFDLYHVYVLAGGDPIKCVAKHAPELRNATERSRHLQVLARRRLKNDHAKNREKIHGPRLAQLGVDARATEKLLREQRRARANRKLTSKDAGDTPTNDSPQAKKPVIPKLDFSHLRKSA